MVDDKNDKNRETRVGRWLIYGLLDPRTKTLIYVGKTHKRREIRLEEHIERANIGTMTPVHKKIREMLYCGYLPEIFVLLRVPPDESWQDAERNQIRYWRNILASQLPIIYPPQTRKSSFVEIRTVELLNVRDGG